MTTTIKPPPPVDNRLPSADYWALAAILILVFGIILLPIWVVYKIYKGSDSHRQKAISATAFVVFYCLVIGAIGYSIVTPSTPAAAVLKPIPTQQELQQHIWTSFDKQLTGTEKLAWETDTDSVSCDPGSYSNHQIVSCQITIGTEDFGILTLEVTHGGWVRNSDHLTYPNES